MVKFVTLTDTVGGSQMPASAELEDMRQITAILKLFEFLT